MYLFIIGIFLIHIDKAKETKYVTRKKIGIATQELNIRPLTFIILSKLWIRG